MFAQRYYNTQTPFTINPTIFTASTRTGRVGAEIQVQSVLEHTHIVMTLSKKVRAFGQSQAIAAQLHGYLRYSESALGEKAVHTIIFSSSPRSEQVGESNFAKVLTAFQLEASLGKSQRTHRSNGWNDFVDFAEGRL